MNSSTRYNTQTTAHLTEGQRVGGDLLDEAALLGWRGKVDAALQDAAAVPVCGDLHRVLPRSIVHKLAVLRAQALQAALDDVVAVEVADQGNHAGLERINHQCHLARLESLTILMLGALKPFWV